MRDRMLCILKKKRRKEKEKNRTRSRVALGCLTSNGKCNSDGDALCSVLSSTHAIKMWEASLWSREAYSSSGLSSTPATYEIDFSCFRKLDSQCLPPHPCPHLWLFYRPAFLLAKYGCEVQQICSAWVSEYPVHNAQFQLPFQFC